MGRAGGIDKEILAAQSGEPDNSRTHQGQREEAKGCRRAKKERQKQKKRAGKSEDKKGAHRGEKARNRWRSRTVAKRGHQKSAKGKWRNTANQAGSASSGGRRLATKMPQRVRWGWGRSSTRRGRHRASEIAHIEGEANRHRKNERKKQGRRCKGSGRRDNEQGGAREESKRETPRLGKNPKCPPRRPATRGKGGNRTSSSRKEPRGGVKSRGGGGGHGPRGGNDRGPRREARRDGKGGGPNGRRQ